MLLTWLDVWGLHQPTRWERVLRANLSASWQIYGLAPRFRSLPIGRFVPDPSLDSTVHLFPFSSFHLVASFNLSSSPSPLSCSPSFSRASSCGFFSSPRLGLPTGWVVKSKHWPSSVLSNDRGRLMGPVYKTGCAHPWRPVVLLRWKENAFPPEEGEQKWMTFYNSALPIFYSPDAK